MKKVISKVLLSIAAFGTLLNAGGSTAPVAAVVAPVTSEDVSHWYLGIGFIPYGKYDSYCPTGCPYEDYTYGAMVRGGYEVNQYIGIEARALGTFWGEGENGGERFRHFGLYAKPMYPVSERINVYGLLGYGYTKTINSGGNGNLPEIDDWTFSWGAGLEFDLSDKKGDFIKNADYDRPFDGYADQERGWGLFIDYQQLFQDHDFTYRNKDGNADIGVISIGVTYDF